MQNQDWTEKLRNEFTALTQPKSKAELDAALSKANFAFNEWESAKLKASRYVEITEAFLGRRLPSNERNGRRARAAVREWIDDGYRMWARHHIGRGRSAA